MINEILNKIEDIDKSVLAKAMAREEALIKPPHSLGVLEDIACRLAAIEGCEKPTAIKKRLLVFASDNGVFEEGVSSCPQNITVDQTINLTRGITGASSMAASFGDEVEVYDLGVNADINKYIDDLNIKYVLKIKNKVIDKKISFSTKNIKKEAAMTREELEKAINVGIEAVKKAKDDGINILGVGEMGIGNTTTSTACLSLLARIAPSTITGRGAGLTDNAYNNKIKVIEDAVARAKNELEKKYGESISAKNTVTEKVISKISDNNISGDQKIELIFDIIRELGGYDIAAMVGAYIGAAYYKMPIVVDGLIAIVSACLAVELNDKIKEYIFLSHESLEPGYKIASDYLDLKPMFNLNMRLGEGSGCIIAFRIIDSSLAMHNNMKTFEEVNIDDSYLNPIR